VEIIDSMQFVFVRTFYTTSRAACGRRLRVHVDAPRQAGAVLDLDGEAVGVDR
jgi:hypothetical protein